MPRATPAMPHRSSGCAFGGLALLYNCPRTATVKATSDSQVWGVPRLTGVFFGGTLPGVVCFVSCLINQTKMLIRSLCFLVFLVVFF